MKSGDSLSDGTTYLISSRPRLRDMINSSYLLLFFTNSSSLLKLKIVALLIKNLKLNTIFAKTNLQCFVFFRLAVDYHSLKQLF